MLFGRFDRRKRKQKFPLEFPTRFTWGPVVVDVHVEVVPSALQTRLETLAEPSGNGAGAVRGTYGRL